MLIRLLLLAFLLEGCSDRLHPFVHQYDMEGIYPRSAGSLNGTGAVLNMNWRIW